MLTVGVLGATGFIGNRVVEVLQTKEQVTVRRIVRRHTAQSCQSNLDYRIADALDKFSLQKAFEGCDVIVHAATGNPGLIRGTVAATYAAAQHAGIRRLIYMSTMCVHGQAPVQGTTEETPLTKKFQPFPYNSAKIDAEQLLLKLRSQGSVEVVIFRPGIVFGPRSPRIIEIVDELLSKSSYLVAGGKGVCNTTYIDNLVHAIWLAIHTDAADNQAFFIGEQELITWADFYRPLAKAFNIDPATIPFVDPVFPTNRSLKQRITEPIRDSIFVQTFLNELKQVIKRSDNQKKEPSFSKQMPLKSQVVEKQRRVTYELTLLHQSPYKLPHHKSVQILGYEPIVSFPEACQKTILWLASEGYPVTSQ